MIDWRSKLRSKQPQRSQRRASRKAKAKPTGYVTIVVAKPACTPARNDVLTALNPYSVKIHKLNCWGEGGTLNGIRVQLAQMAEVTVSAAAGKWAEYLLMRAPGIYVASPPIDERNRAWAEKHKGTMPTPWKDGKPWVEKSCSDGIEAWKKAKAKAK